jgi:hypothetical protein
MIHRIVKMCPDPKCKSRCTAISDDDNPPRRCDYRRYSETLTCTKDYCIRGWKCPSQIVMNAEDINIIVYTDPTSDDETDFSTKSRYHSFSESRTKWNEDDVGPDLCCHIIDRVSRRRCLEACRTDGPKRDYGRCNNKKKGITMISETKRNE